MLGLFKKKTDDGQASSNFLARLFDKNEKEIAKLQPTIDQINQLSEQFQKLTDDEVKAKSDALRQKFRDEVTARLEKQGQEWRELETEIGWSNEYVRIRKAAESEVLDELLPEAFALVREAGSRTIGLRHFDVQMIGGAVLHSGRIAEMRTGEGKTLVATLPAYLNSLSGRGVHVITVNDYLAERDANWMRPIYEFLGLTVSFLYNDMTSEERIPAYRSDVLYATNSEVGFDYLRDNMARTAEEVVQRALNFAIVDEVDNILIDEARTPLIISAQVAKTERAMRRQQLAKICDGVARKLMPAVTDREVEILIDSLTHKGRVSLDTLMEEIEKRGAFGEATGYLIESYLLSEASARTHSAARLLDVAQEYFESGLLNESGRAALEESASSAAKPQKLSSAWRDEVARLVAPFAHAWAHANEIGFESLQLAEVLAADLALPEEVISELPKMLAAEDRKHAVAGIIADEVQARGFIDDPNPIIELLENLDADDYPQELLTETILENDGALHDAEKLLLEAAAGEAEVLSPGQIRVVVDTLETIAQQNLAPFQTQEKLWEAIELPDNREQLKKQIARAIEEHSGETVGKIAQLTADYLSAREEFLADAAAKLKAELGGHDSLVKRAQSGESTEELRALLQSEIAKSGAFAAAMKEVKSFITQRGRAHTQLAEGLVKEMEQWVELPRDARKQFAAMFEEGGTPETVRERLLLSTRDLPGENTEIPAIVGESTRQLQVWRDENAAELLEKLQEQTALPAEVAGEIQNAIAAGEHTSDFDRFVGEQLLSAPEIAPLAAAVDEFGQSWDTFRSKQNDEFIQKVGGLLPLSGDLQESLSELLDKPLVNSTPQALGSALLDELAGDAVNRHLEPLLTSENAVAFTEEIKRRIPLAKEVQNRLKPDEFAGKSDEQLRRTIYRVVQKSLQIMPFDDYKRVVKNLAWRTEKDERRRTAALTDMGTLIAERHTGNIAFSEPENFLETLLNSDILTDVEVAVIKQAQAETPEETITSLVDRVLRLPAERRRRLAEAKLQEVQPVLDQSVKAHALFHREVNYVIDMNPETGKREVVIVDEFTGRKMPGRRYSEGLHEALEAKHGLEVQLESQTVATITIQNYFRLYNKLAGMTGTAKTEEAEFAKTYGVEVISIPTNRPIQRIDHPDVVYKTAEAKFRAITFEILERHCVDQPVLAGTRSVEVSERLSERLKAQSLQTLVLSHICKAKLWESKEYSEEDKEQVLQLLRAPILQLPLPQVKNIARQIGVNPDPLAAENLDKILSLFSVNAPNRERLESALRVGLPHNVLNAKNHRNEARIVAEAARPGAVTIATNMAGRGVDILLGGTLDIESRWRVFALQILARHLEGQPVHARSRNQETTDKLQERLTAERLQELAWVLAVRNAVDQLESSGQLQGQAVKEIRDAIGQELGSSDLRTRIKSRARRLGLLDQLPLDDDPLTDAGPARAVADEIKKLLQIEFDAAQIQEVLRTGIEAHSQESQSGEDLILTTLASPLAIAQNSTAALLEALNTLPDMDELLLRSAADSGAERVDDFDLSAIAESVGHASAEWVQERLKALHVHDAPSARHQLELLDKEEIEISEGQIARALGEAFLGLQWLRERLRGWNLVRNERAYEADESTQQLLGDNAVVHHRLNRATAEKLWHDWQNDGDKRRAMVILEAPNLVLLSDMANRLGEQPEFLNPEWLHHALAAYGVITGEEDVFPAQMEGQAEDEHGNIQTVPLDILVYRLQLPKVLNALIPILHRAQSEHGNNLDAIEREIEERASWALPFVDREWIESTLDADQLDPEAERAHEFSAGEAVPLLIETGVAGQSSDIVLEGETPPEELAHTSEREQVTQLGGIHIIGSERHESRRIDNQLRGRAGRQGDPGSSRFFISLEDELWRLFGTRGQFLLSKWDEDEPVEAKMISASVERAQKKVELNHFEGRKHVLQYDDVMNVQREKIYGERRRALMGQDMRETALGMAHDAALAEADKHCPRALRREEWDTHKLYAGLTHLFGSALLARHLRADALHEASNRDEIDELISSAVTACYTEREAAVGEETMRGFERWQVMKSIDEYWMEHLAEMDYLRDAIWQEGYAQKEPIGVYRQEGFALFAKMLGEIRREVTQNLFAMQFDTPAESTSSLNLQSATEGRLVPPIQHDEDGLDDGVQLHKAAGTDSGNVQVMQSDYESTSSQPLVATIDDSRDSAHDGNRQLTRAERRKAQRKARRKK